MSNSTLNPITHPIRTLIGGVFMHVSNMERSVDWYHRFFGLPDRSSVTDKVHAIAMDNNSNFVLDQHGYDRGLAIGDRPLLMLESPDVHAAYRFALEQGIQIEWEIEEYPGMAFFTLRDPDHNLLMVCGKPGSKEGGASVNQDLKTAESRIVEQVRYDGGGTMLKVSPISAHAVINNDGLTLTGRASTEQSYPTPVRIETTVRIEGGCLRLYYGPHGVLTFNYGPSADGGSGSEFYVIPPAVDKTFSYLNYNTIPELQWVRLDWTIHERYMEVHLDDQLFYRQEGYYGNVLGQAGIGADNGVVSVRSFVVEPLSPVEALPMLAITSNDVKNGDILMPDVACFPVSTQEGLWLSTNKQWGSARTNRKYTVPFQCRVQARADTNSLILYGDASLRLKFHPDGNMSFQDTVGKEENWTDGKMGRLPTGETEIIWTVESDRIQVSVDGKLRFDRRGDYASRSFGIGIGPDHGSTVIVRSMDISPL